MSKLNGLYSKQIYWPENVQAVIDHVLSCPHFIDATLHAKEKMNQLCLPDRIYKAMAHGEIIEAEFTNGRLVKIVTRLPHKSRPVDICAAIIIAPENRYGILRVKTVWTNNHNDNHSTIDKRAYVNGENKGK